ncbi:MAG: hypothetical protein Q9182_001183 [Xanthomendoza sp. 2 TL-2023]
MDWSEAVEPIELQALSEVDYDALLLLREANKQLDEGNFSYVVEWVEAVEPTEPPQTIGEIDTPGLSREEEEEEDLDNIDFTDDMHWFEALESEEPPELQRICEIDPPAIPREDEEGHDEIDFPDNMDWLEALAPVEPPELQEKSEEDNHAVSRKTDEELNNIKWSTMCDLPYYHHFAKGAWGHRFVKQLAPDCRWNYNGRISSCAEAAIAAILENAMGSLRDLRQHGAYLLLDGNVGALLYHLHEDKAGTFVGPSSPDEMWRDVLGAARVVFNTVALAEDVLTQEPMYLLFGEQCRTGRVGSSFPPSANYQTSPDFRALMRENFAALLSNVNNGCPEANARLAIERVQVNENGSVAVGLEAFVKLVAGHNAGKGAFPEKQFQNIHILAHGRLGFVEYIWESIQRGDYVGMSSHGAMVRQRGMLFLMVNGSGLVAAATGVYDERELPWQIQYGRIAYV